ncbi:MAG: NlpC/P60 family protein [Bacillota bacterium]
MSPWEQALSRLPRQIRWVHHGRDPHVGLDCVGLILCVYRSRGIDLADLDVPYGRRDFLRFRRAGVVFERLLRWFREVPFHALAEGDVLATRCEGAPSHLAIVVGQRVYQMTAGGLWCSSIPHALLTTERAFRYCEGP